MSNVRTNLIISAIGGQSKHLDWINKTDRSYDFIAICYEKVKPQVLSGAKIAIDCNGYKFDMIGKFLCQNPVYLQYDSIFLPDDDLIMTPQHIEDLFKTFKSHSLNLAQPALDLASFYSHKITRWGRSMEVLLRYTNFVEIMCPIFSKKAMTACLPTFSLNQSGYGLDFVWPALLKNSGVAIVDSVQIHHPRKVQSKLQFKKRGIDAIGESIKITKLFNCPNYKEYKKKVIAYQKAA